MNGELEVEYDPFSLQAVVLGCCRTRHAEEKSPKVEQSEVCWSQVCSSHVDCFESGGFEAGEIQASSVLWASEMSSSCSPTFSATSTVGVKAYRLKEEEQLVPDMEMESVMFGDGGLDGAVANSFSYGVSDPEWHPSESFTCSSCSSAFQEMLLYSWIIKQQEEQRLWMEEEARMILEEDDVSIKVEAVEEFIAEPPEAQVPVDITAGRVAEDEPAMQRYLNVDKKSRLRDFQAAYMLALQNKLVIDVDDVDYQSESESPRLPSLLESRDTTPDNDEKGNVNRKVDFAPRKSANIPVAIPLSPGHWSSSSVHAIPLEVPTFIPLACSRRTRSMDSKLVSALRNRRAGVDRQESPSEFEILEADVYAKDPARLLRNGSGVGYFFTNTKYYTSRAARSRVTLDGCRWKQQGPSLPIRVDGQVVAYKTYLSFVQLKNNVSGASGEEETYTGSRRWSRFTMEEIALKDDREMELRSLAANRAPRPFEVLCRISCRSSGLRRRSSVRSKCEPTDDRRAKRRKCCAKVPGVEEKQEKETDLQSSYLDNVCWLNLVSQICLEETQYLWS